MWFEVTNNYGKDVRIFYTDHTGEYKNITIQKSQVTTIRYNYKAESAQQITYTAFQVDNPSTLVKIDNRDDFILTPTLQDNIVKATIQPGTFYYVNIQFTNYETSSVTVIIEGAVPKTIDVQGQGGQNLYFETTSNAAIPITAVLTGTTTTVVVNNVAQYTLIPSTDQSSTTSVTLGQQIIQYAMYVEVKNEIENKDITVTWSNSTNQNIETYNVGAKDFLDTTRAQSAKTQPESYVITAVIKGTNEAVLLNGTRTQTLQWSTAVNAHQILVATEGNVFQVT